MIGFVVAMEKEAKIFLAQTNLKSSTEIAGKTIYFGSLLNKDFVLIISGIGKVNASISTQILVDKFDIDYIINFGVAGGKASSNLEAGDIVLISSVCQYDFDLSEIDNVNIGYMQDYDLTFYPTAHKQYTGNFFKIRKGASGDRFTQNTYWLDIIAKLGGEVVDMECGAIAQTALANKTPLFIIKLISDVDGDDKSIFEQYVNNVREICDKFPNAIRELIDNIDFK